MPRRIALLLVCVLALAGCGEEIAPTEQETFGTSTTAKGAAEPETGGVAPEAPEAGPADPPLPQAAGSGKVDSAVAPSTPTAAAAADGSCAGAPNHSPPDPQRPRYRMNIDVRLAENAVVGDLAVDFTPDIRTDRIVFRLWPNGPRSARHGARLDVFDLRVDGKTVPASVENATTLVGRPDGGIAAGRKVTITLPWRLTLPNESSDRVSRSGDAVRLGSFFPILSWEPGVGWSTNPPTSAFAEASSAPVADWSVSVKIPPGLTALASGVYDRPGHWQGNYLRDWAMSLGRFNLAGVTVAAPHPVRVTVGVHAGINESPLHYAQRAAAAIADFGRRFGGYPDTEYDLAITPGLSGGIEYPGHVMQGPGTAGRTTPHEVAHMFFYSLAGNDQGRDPWLDEGLATYAEGRFEGSLGGMRSTSIPADARGRLGEPMTYWEGHQASYYRGVYVQGAQALSALGPLDQVDCALRHHVTRNAHRITTNKAVLDALSAVFPNAREVFGRYGVRG
ncbi:MAG TPA: hypothetical protein VMY88_03725 [Acidimicrobiales bacterium]|nr:hypothetical protein [Acidimicrobiales bacterium]